MNELQKLADCKITAIGFEEFPEMEFSSWLALGHRLCRAHKALQWAAADWVNIGEMRYGGKVKPALHVLNRKYSTVMNWCGVGEMFPFSRRREKLTFTHHALFLEFKDLTDKQQDKYLDAAEKDELSVADLREMIRLDLADVGKGPLTVEDERPNPLRYLTEFTLSLQRLGDPHGWPKPQREAWKKELQPIVDLYQAL